MTNIKKFENYMSKEEMCSHLCRCGYSMNELENCSTQELEEMCRLAELDNMNSENSTEMNEGKKKWIQDAIKRPGALRSKMKKGEGEKISKSEINDELNKLKAKDKNPGKKGVQGLSKNDLTKFRQLNLAKTLKGLKEHQEQENYMFFSNLQTIKRLVDELLQMDESKLDHILSDGHGWALDHIATSKDDIEEVFNFLASHDEPHDVDQLQQRHRMMHDDSMMTDEDSSHVENEGEMKGIKSFQNFKK